MRKKKERQYFCLKNLPIFNGSFTDQLKEDIKNEVIFFSISLGGNSSKIELCNCTRKTWLWYEKTWLKSAPIHAIVAAKLRGEI